ncbi:non-ribosomal peptide synthetase, partial [Hymenobacter lucidus]
EEREELLVGFQGEALPGGDAMAAGAEAGTVLDLLAAQVATQPTRAAVVTASGTLSYAALEARANQLAHALQRDYGLRPGQLVGLLAERGPQALIGVWAILKAGGAYVPLDPDYPAARRQFLLSDAAPAVLLTQTDYLFELGDYAGAVFALDVQLDELDTPPTAPVLAPALGAQSPAYVIYTSGSTGQPKGVLVTHGNLLHATRARLATYSGVEAFLLLSSLAFDSSVAGLFGTLGAGGTLLLPPAAALGDVPSLAQWARQQGVTHLLTVPSYYQLLLAEFAQVPNALRQVIVAGEACPLSLVERHQQAPALQQCTLFNEYGPTEATVWSTVHAYGRDEPVRATIGRPIAGTQVLVLDAARRLVPVGVAGELCVAGPGLAQGYLHQPELTADKFVAHPFAPGQRLYRTGDVARWQAQGTLEFLGRGDHQVKIRGYRLELGEVERALLTHPQLVETVVVARPGAGEASSLELVAYVVSPAGVELTAGELQAYLSQRLPAHAVPAQFVALAQLPRTVHGKVDAGQLPDPQAQRLGTGVAYQAARTAVEALLVGIYEQVLGRTPIGIEEDFFALGGDSIKSIQIVSRLRQGGYAVAIQDILLYPRIAALAARVQPVSRQSEQGLITGPVPLGPIQHWFFGLHLAAPHHFNQSVLLRSRGPVVEKGLRASLDQLVLHHDALRTVFAQEAETGQWQQQTRGKEQGYGWQVLPYEAASFAAECDRIQASLDLGTGPLLQAALFRDPAGQQDRLLLVCHHLVIDGVSWRVVLEDLSTLYGQYRQGVALSLPAKTDAFQYWQQQQQAYAQSSALAQQLPYWQHV